MALWLIGIWQMARIVLRKISGNFWALVLVDQNQQEMELTPNCKINQQEETAAKRSAPAWCIFKQPDISLPPPPSLPPRNCYQLQSRNH